MGSNSFIRFLTAFIALTFFFIFACSPDDGGNSGAMDGTWEMDDFVLEISGNAYLLKWDGVNETKGTVTYDDSTFEFIITHDEWVNGKWKEVEGDKPKIFGNYERNGETSVFSEVYRDDYDGYGSYSYSWFSGEWKKIK